MPEIVDVQTANSLRTALNHASFDPSIVGSVDSQLLTKLNGALANSFKATEVAARTMLKPGSIKVQTVSLSANNNFRICLRVLICCVRRRTFTTKVWIDLSSR